MIEEPPPLVFAASQERPADEIVERFRGTPTCFIVDAMNGTGALDWRIRRLVGGPLAGVALTCDCGPLDNLAFMAALAQSQPGDVLVGRDRRLYGSGRDRGPAHACRAQSRGGGARH